MAVQIRPLKASDAKKVVTLITNALQDKMEISGGNLSLTPADFLQILQNNLESLWAWLADIGKMTPEQLDDAALSAPLDIIEAIGNSEEGADFFARALYLLKQGQKAGEKAAPDTAA